MQEVLDTMFKNGLPSTLYLTHYELAEKFPITTPNEWRQYLKDNEHFITSETAAIAEAQARKALNSLANATSAEVSAIKALLEKSKLINEAQKQQQHVLLTYLPQKGDEDQVKALKFERELLIEFQRETVHMALMGRYDATQHTLDWFKPVYVERRYLKR